MRKNTKEAIVEAAIVLFNTKGYNGTTIRDIAGRANINTANIAYYFTNKQGLLEYCFTTFFEEYMKELEEGFSHLESGATGCLKKIAENLLTYQCKHIQLTRLILREMSIDSQIVREIMSTYYVKERYYFKEVFETGMKTKEFGAHSIQYMIIQFKGLLAMPFLNTHYVTEVLHIFPHERYFSDKYLQDICRWIEGVVCSRTHEQRVYRLSV